MRIDLHTHSACSDGTDTPAELVKEASRAGLHVLALTDHDTTVGWAEAQEAADAIELRLVPGIELSTRNGGQSQHLLGYAFDPDHPVLVEMLSKGFASREGRIPTTLARLAELGVPVEEHQVRAGVTDGTIGRNHVADALIAAGHVIDRGQAFDRYLAPNAAAYVARYTPDIIDAITAIRAAGGVTVVAHPWGRQTSVSEKRFAELSAAGLAGIEVDHQEHDGAARGELRGIARNLGLVVTGSSDYHGTRKVGHDLGCNLTTEAAYERLLQGRLKSAAVAPPVPSDLEAGFDLVRPMPQLRLLVSAVATRAPLTAQPGTPDYVGVRPAAHGVVAGYVNRSFVDLRLAPERAKQIANIKGWKLQDSNSYTGTLRVLAQVLDDATEMALVVDLFLEALDKSAAGPPFEGGNLATKGFQRQWPPCPTCGIEMLGGACERCE